MSTLTCKKKNKVKNIVFSDVFLWPVYPVFGGIGCREEGRRQGQENATCPVKGLLTRTVTQAIHYYGIVTDKTRNTKVDQSLEVFLLKW